VKALVVGCGRVGSTLARSLQKSGWNVSVVDETEDALTRLGESWTGEFHLGHGMDTKVLEAAGIGDADAVIVATDGDNTNIVVAQIAQRRYNVPTVIARILDPYRASWYEHQGVHTICPTKVAIEMLENEVRTAANGGAADGAEVS